jgi:arylsulfatase A-like enzyme
MPPFNPFLFRTLGLLFLVSTLLAGCGQKEQAPNIVLITLDTVRSDYLGCYGSSWVKTPNLDAFAEKGVLFNEATCLIPATLTSHTSLLTSLYPRKSGVRFGSFVVPEEVTTLAERLSDQGYQTAAFLSAAVLEKKYGLNQGFAVYDDGPLHPFERSAEEINEKVFDWLETRHDPKKPAFLWIHYYDAHTPYHPPAPWDKEYDPDYQGKLTGASSDITQLLVARGIGATTEDLNHLRALYAGEISALDERVGELFRKLDSTLKPENTLTAVLSDHGEMLGEHHKFFHGEDLYDPALLVPFILTYPGKIPAGRVVEEFVSLLDFAPTVLSLAVLPPLEGAEGADLSPWILEESPPESRRLNAFLESEEPFLNEGDKVLGARTDRWKYIDNRAMKRPPALYGRLVNEYLDRPMFAQVFVKGSTQVSVSAHIRYHSRDTLPMRSNAPNLSAIPSTYIRAIPFGSDPAHLEALESGALGKPNEGWRAIATPNLYERAKEFGEVNNYPTDFMVIESVAVDMAVPWNQFRNEALIDNLELVALQDPKGGVWRRMRPIADMETGKAADTLVEAATGPLRAFKSDWGQDSAFPGPLNLSQKLTVRFLPMPQGEEVNELYDLAKDPGETHNLFRATDNEAEREQILEVGQGLAERVTDWVQGTQGYTASSAALSAEERDQMQRVGYFR